jgi:hypothetical protein
MVFSSRKCDFELKISIKNVQDSMEIISKLSTVIRGLSRREEIHSSDLIDYKITRKLTDVELTRNARIKKMEARDANKITVTGN